MRRIQDAVAEQDPLRGRTDRIEVVLDLDDLPVGNAEVLDQQLLPVRLVRPGRVGEPNGERYRLGQPFAPGEAACHGEHGRGVPSARERHDAGRSLEGGQDRGLERLARRGARLGGGDGRGVGRAERDAERDLQRRRPERVRGYVGGNRASSSKPSCVEAASPSSHAWA